MPQYARLTQAVTTRRHRLPTHPDQTMSGSANRRIRFPVRSIGAFADKGAQLVVPEIRAEGRHARLQSRTGRQRPDRQGIEAQVIDQRGNRGNVLLAVSGDGDGLSPGFTRGVGAVLQVVVAHVVEGLHHPGPRQALLDDLAAGSCRIRTVLPYAVGLPPVVHGVDDELAAQFLGGDRVVLPQRKREDHCVSAGRRLGRPHWSGAWGKDFGCEGDPGGVTGAGQQDLVPGIEREASKYSPQLAGAKDAQGADGCAHRPALTGSGPSVRISRTSGITFVPKSSTARSRELAGTAPPVV